MDTPVIEVRMWGRRVGAVAPDPRLGCYVFAYDPAWRRSGIELAPISMPLGDTRSSFAFPDLAEASYKRLPGLLADALPDDFGNALIDAWMSSKGVEKRAITTLDRLGYMGKRGMGALEFKPARGSHRESAEPIEMQRLVEAARTVIRGDLTGDVAAQAALANIIRVGTSAGGARAKAVIQWNSQTNQIRSGQFDASPGFEHWLLKFDGLGKDKDLGASQDYGRIEFAYSLMARDAGIEISDCRLLEENGRAHFMTRRFDRDAGNVRHHVQTLCAMSHMDYKKLGTNSYAQLFDAASRLKRPYSDLEEIFRRMAFNVMGRNCDDHSKNFSFRLKRGGNWELAPAYDVTFAHSPTSKWTHQHLMSVNGKFKDFTKGDLLEVADRFGVGTAPRVLEHVCDAIRAWRKFAKEAGVPIKPTQEIEAFLLPLT